MRLRTVRSLSLVGYLAVGFLGGALYALVDGDLDERLASGTLTGGLRYAHDVLGHLLPIVTGLLVGFVTHSLRERSRAAVSERARADSLRSHLDRVERDQAVWVMSTSVLHEVRNPLHALGLLLDDLRATLGDGSRDALALALTDRARAHMERIAAHLQALRSLPAAGRPERVETDVAAVLDETRRAAATVLRANGVTLRVHTTGAGRALCDAAHLRVILETLIENSLQAIRQRTRQGHGPGLLQASNATAAGRIDLDATDEADGVVVRVVDDGPGIAEADVPGLFQPLRSTKDGGLGLGLSIARALARAMEAELTLEGSAPSRTTFRLRLQPVGTR